MCVCVCVCVCEFVCEDICPQTWHDPEGFTCTYAYVSALSVWTTATVDVISLVCAYHTYIHTHTQHRAKPGQTTVEHPCLLNGTNVTFHDATTDGVQHAVGTSDHDACLELQEQLLSDCAHTPEGKCQPMNKVRCLMRL